jgi:hypothetical protein
MPSPGLSTPLEGETGLSTKINAKSGPVLRKTHSFSILPAQARLRALRSLLFYAVVFHPLALGSIWAQPASDEYHMKAAFLFHFAQLVEWPSAAFDGSDSSLALCTLDDDAFYDELENTIQGKQIGSRLIRIRHVHLSQVARGCNMLFISRSESKSLPLAALRNLPVLTVGESDDFLSSGGMIRFHRAEDKIRFDINLAAADSSHLKISSRLLILATSVIRGSGMAQEK